MVPYVQLSPNVGFVILVEIKIFFHSSNSLFYSWLTTADVVPWPSLCIKISLVIVSRDKQDGLEGRKEK